MGMETSLSSKNICLSLDDYDKILPLAHALSTDLRLRILCLIVNRGLGVNEIARALDVPISTVALNVQVLERAGLISCEAQPGVRGTQKLCARKIDEVRFQLWQNERNRFMEREYDMPVGGFTRAVGIQPTCGMASHEQSFQMDDSPEAFFHPMRFQADILWTREGYLEYSFPKAEQADQLEYLEFSFEACSEAPGYRHDWPSDIYVCVNGVELGVWRCPGDFGGHRGKCNPEWWPTPSTQYGELKTWRVDRYAVMLDNQVLSKVTLSDLRLDAGECVTLRIGAKKAGEHSGGLNLFGAKFGDYPQNIRLRYVYASQNASENLRRDEANEYP